MKPKTTAFILERPQYLLCAPQVCESLLRRHRWAPSRGTQLSLHLVATVSVSSFWHCPCGAHSQGSNLWIWFASNLTFLLELHIPAIISHMYFILYTLFLLLPDRFLPIFSRSKKALLFSKMILSKFILMLPSASLLLMATNADMVIAILSLAFWESFSCSFSSATGNVRNSININGCYGSLLLRNTNSGLVSYSWYSVTSMSYMPTSDNLDIFK